jgi:gluconate 2-dehydrogenase gamma chain
MAEISRRDLLKRAGAAGAVAAAVPTSAMSPDAQAAGQTPEPARDPLETLSPGEAETLDAMVARLIPSDANGPGAREARAAHYIDRALGGALAGFRETYLFGLTSLNTFANASKGARFSQLSATDQDELLSAVERNAVPGFGPPSDAIFFNLVLGHTLQGTFGDPYYGGNRDFAGWDLLRYPGVRLAVTPDEQKLDQRPRQLRMSAYDYEMFRTRRPARAGVDQPPKDGRGD